MLYVAHLLLSDCQPELCLCMCMFMSHVVVCIQNVKCYGTYTHANVLICLCMWCVTKTCMRVCVLAGGQGAVVQPVYHDAGHNGGLPQAERHPLPSPGWQYTRHRQVSTLHSAFVYLHA